MEGIGCCCGGDATVSGTVTGCTTTPIAASRIAGAVVTVVSGATGGPFTADASGNYSGTIHLTGSGGTVVLSAAAPAPNDVRFAANTQSFTATVGGTHTGINFGLLPATGFHCLVGAHTCPYPIANTLHGTDPTFGAFTLTYGSNGIGQGWSVALNPAYTGVSGCAGQGSIALGHSLTPPAVGGNPARWTIQWIATLANDCPIISAANAWTGAGQKYSSVVSIAIVACLPFSITASFSVAGFGNSLAKVYASNFTITLTE
jgi:hypothetical protein